MNELLVFLFRFGFNFLIAFLLVRFIYYPTTHDKRYVFTFLLFNTMIYLVLAFMAKIEIGIGVGFGLFAIFSTLRYRTDPIPIREMTYMFIISALPLMNSAISNTAILPQLAAANLAVLAIMLVLEKEWGFRYDSSKRILYEKIELIRPDRRAELLADIEERTGLKVKRIVIEKVDFLHDSASLQVFYSDLAHEGWLQNGGALAAAAKDDSD
jgi:hypothetical protein